MNQLSKQISNYWIIILFVGCFQLNTSAQLSTQVGIGAVFIHGDIDHVFDPLNSFHLGIAKSIRDKWNIELKLGVGKAIGLSGISAVSADNGGILVEDIYNGVGNNPWYPNYLSTYSYVDLGVNYIIETGIDRLRLIAGAGIGISNSSTGVNLFHRGDTVRYDIQLPMDTDTKTAKEVINRTYDNTYETSFDQGSLTPHMSLQFGIQFRITRGIYFSVDARYHITNSDYLDPMQYVSPSEESGNNDSVGMLSIGFMGYLLPDEREKRSPVSN
ncbi:MAG: hypothetical protein AAGA77_15235 [Bacteroidota bacterium]